MSQFRDSELVIIIAGSQGQEGSSLQRAVFGEHRTIQINPRDKVIFSADAIPGNEIPYYHSIDELSKNKIDVVYPGISKDIHHTGHASAVEQRRVVDLVKPKLLMPIGGADRHRELFRKRVAHKLGYRDKQILIPETGDIISLSNGRWKILEKISLKPKIVDGLGIGDVGPVVLSDRRALSEAGMVVAVIPRHRGRFKLDKIEIVSRGFVFMKQADEVIKFIEDTVADIITHNQNFKDYALKKEIEKQLSKKVYKIIQREPIVVAVILDE